MSTDALTFLLVVAVVAILVLISRVSALSKDMRGQATILFEHWKRRDYDSLQREEAERAGRDASITLGQWKADSERNIRRDAVTRSQAVTVGKVSEHIAPYLPF